MATKLKSWAGQAGLQWMLGMLLTWLVSASSIAAVIAASDDFWRRLGDTRWPLSVAAGSAAGLLVTRRAGAWRKDRGRGPIYDSSYPECDPEFEILERINRYTISDPGEFQYSRRYRVRAMKDRLNSFTDRYIWTGPDADLKPQPGDNVALVNISHDTTLSEQTWIDIIFERKLNAGDEYEFEVHWPPMPDWPRSRPFLSSSTREPTHRIVFEVTIPQRFRQGRRAWFEVLRTASDADTFTTDECAFDDSGRLWVVHDLPKLYHCYRVRWQWSPAVTGPDGP
jgi:hypothetical protein